MRDQLEAAARIAHDVRETGGRALIVGGFVRDRLLGLEAKDIDVEVYGLEAARLKGLLARVGPVNTVGESFTVYKVAGLDVSLPRRESKVGPRTQGLRRHRRSVPHAGGGGAAPRLHHQRHRLGPAGRRVSRPVTAAAMTSTPASCGRWTLRTFGDDSLRVLRAMQFAARFDCTLDAPTTAALCRAIPLDDLPAERVWGEMEKLLLRAARPSIGFELARSLDVVDSTVARARGARGLPAGSRVASRR